MTLNFYVVVYLKPLNIPIFCVIIVCKYLTFWRSEKGIYLSRFWKGKS
jgi:hypothetical protein